MTSMNPEFIDSAKHDKPPALAILRELEISLAASQKHLLSGDVTALELETTRQIRLLHQMKGQIMKGQIGEQVGNRIRGQINDQIDTFTNDAEPITELQAVCARVWHLGQVQSALLARASRRLRMIANVMAGPQAAYAANASRFGAQSPTAFSGATVLNGENPCRA